MKTQLMKRAAALCLAVVLTLSVNAAALFGGKEKAQPAEGSPTAQALEIRTYRGIPYHAQFLAAGGEGEDLTFTVEKEPKKGTVQIDGASFISPRRDATGSDHFTYTATDSAGRVSQPATVSVTIEKAKSGVTYADTADSAACGGAAQDLAEAGIFTGAKIGDQYYFEPDKPVSRSEFLAMVMETAGDEPTAVTMTGFCDDAAIPTWAKAYAAAGVADGIIQGVSTAEGVAFQGDEPITFNEAATVLNRVLAVEDVDLASWYADREAGPPGRPRPWGTWRRSASSPRAASAAPPWGRPSPGRTRPRCSPPPAPCWRENRPASSTGSSDGNFRQEQTASEKRLTLFRRACGVLGVVFGAVCAKLWNIKIG